MFTLLLLFCRNATVIVCYIQVLLAYMHHNRFTMAFMRLRLFFFFLKYDLVKHSFRVLHVLKYNKVGF